MLEGVLRVRVGESEVEARAGSAVFVPRGTPHTYWNPGEEPARYLLVMTSHIYRLLHEIHALADRSPAALSAVFAKYDSQRLDGQSSTTSGGVATAARSTFPLLIDRSVGSLPLSH